ncbi:hypothetical protein [Kribbella sp. NPDC000426]|uniref:hypothetical protein n=1 Tax=Kribbella sp. NPDC000426 TaxID=3154255 RepID=UPI00331BFF00
MTTQVDLNEIRRAMIEAQREQNPYPTDPAKTVSVTRNGHIQMGLGDDPVHTSKVQQGTFASAPSDATVASQKLPPNARWIEAGGVKGWAYTITTELGNPFSMLAYNNGSEYRVLLLSPEIEGKYNAHNAHLYANGHICLREGGANGQPTLEEAYSKSVLWANGMDFHMAGYDFPFSANNL